MILQIDLVYEQRNINPFFVDSKELNISPVRLCEEIGEEGRDALFEILYINYKKEFDNNLRFFFP